MDSSTRQDITEALAYLYRAAQNGTVTPNQVLGVARRLGISADDVAGREV